MSQRENLCAWRALGTVLENDEDHGAGAALMRYSRFFCQGIVLGAQSHSR